MQHEMIMIRYGELSTKGKNKRDFINQLARNIKEGLKNFSKIEYQVRHDHIYLILHGEDYLSIATRLKDISGIASFSPVYRVKSEMETILETSLMILKEANGKTFKVRTKRAYKLFPLISDEINRAVATKILKNTDYKVDVHNPDILLQITIREDATYLFIEGDKGAGGYPLGIQGKGLMMISGGIDSPVATYLMMKRGIKMECVHFASPPYTSEAVIDKIKDILRKLNRFQPEIKLYIVPFTKLQEEIYRVAKESYAITIMRRMMYRISERIATHHNDLVICNGESIGQVASQTLKSIREIENVVTLPVIRPLAIFDKVDIIELSKKIETYDISIRPYEDCCTIFDPKNPTTQPKKETIDKIEASFDFEALISECLLNIKTVVIKEESNLEDKFL